MSSSENSATVSPLADMLAGLLNRLSPDSGIDVAAPVAELVAAHAQGHVCLPLRSQAARRLRSSPLVGKPGDYAPLLLDGADRLYFARHWHDEHRLAVRLSAMAADVQPADAARVRAALDPLFPSANLGQGPDRQKLAAALAARQRLLVISGGPGTGKTTTVVRLLALIASLSPRPLVMAMAAPTGKAAARLSESVQKARDALPVAEAVRGQLPGQAQTLHRLLGLRPGQARPRYHAGQPLPLDVLVVDEASMIDLELMARTVDALPPHARLVLLGDRDQLPSVDAGAVLADLCGRVAYRPATRQWLAEASGETLPETPDALGKLADCVMLLTHSHRFRADSGIGELARSVNAGEGEAAWRVLQEGRFDDIELRPALDETALMAGRRDYLQAIRAGAPLDEAQAAFGRFMALAGERRQVAQINAAMERSLEAEGLKQPGRDWYPGRPVMIAANDYGLGLFNGDIGFAVARDVGVRVAFPMPDGEWREFAPGRLPEHDTVFAMTVHKSQGSEFDEVWLALPDRPGNVLDRPLVYTAITRARRRFVLAGAKPVWDDAVSRVNVRYSGLPDQLL